LVSVSCFPIACFLSRVDFGFFGHKVVWLGT
jgi:hypothetical protein